MDEFLLIFLPLRRIIVFITSISVVRKLSISIAIALVGGILAPLATATSASASTPLNGNYSCTTGLRQANPSELIPIYTITDGVLSDGGNCDGTVVIPAGVTRIGDGAFQGPLTSITIPATVTSIGDYAFAGSYLTSITFAQGSQLTSIGSSAFSSTSALTSITIPATVISIGAYAFSYATALTSINIPASVTDIGIIAFANACSLTSITVDSGNQNYTSANGVLFNKAATTLIQYPLSKSDPSYSIPATVTSIGEQAFAYPAAFLTSIAIPASVTSIEDAAFESAMSLTSITFNQGSQLTSIGDYAFHNAIKLTSITIPASVTSIGEGAFDGASSLPSIAVDSDNQNYSSVDGVLLNKDATTLIQYPVGNSDTLYSIPVTVTSIIKDAFANASSLISITIPASVTSIGRNAFYGATALTSITIPASVTSIGDYAFTNSTALKDVYFLGNAPAIGEDVFIGIATGAKVHRSSTATGFGTESTWNRLIVPVNYTVSYDSANGTVVAAGSFTTGGSIQTAPVSTRAGYTLSGWSTSANGSVVTFPYSPTATTDITLYAIWTPIPVKAIYASGVKLTGKAKVGKSITVAPGSWTGTVPITYKYQWYSCKVASKTVLKTGKAAPKCTVIKKATNASFKVTTKEKGSFLAAKITGRNSVGSSGIFTATVGKVS
jgi:uncharacterized repeat protein (TIGR02543 family)